jgi:predicted enzyme related to lactoylglutathione lyase
MAHGEFAHMEIPADDPAAVIPFYAGVFGWKIAPMEGFDDYHAFMTGPGNSGGAIGKRGVSVADRLRVYIDVVSIDDALATATRLGGSVSVPKTEIGGMGWYAAITDPEGGEMALFEAAPAG